MFILLKFLVVVKICCKINGKKGNWIVKTEIYRSKRKKFQLKRGKSNNCIIFGYFEGAGETPTPPAHSVISTLYPLPSTLYIPLPREGSGVGLRYLLPIAH